MLGASTPCAFISLACICAPFVRGWHAGDSILMRAHLVTLHAGLERLRNTTVAPTYSFYQYTYLPNSTKTFGKLRWSILAIITCMVASVTNSCWGGREVGFSSPSRLGLDMLEGEGVLVVDMPRTLTRKTAVRGCRQSTQL